MRTTIFALLFLTLVSCALSATIGGTGAAGPLQISVSNDATMLFNYAAFFNHPNQFYSSNSKGSVLYYNNGATRHKYSSSYFGHTAFSAASNVATGNTMTAVFNVNSAVFTQVTSYTAGDLFYTITYIVHNNGATPLTNVIVGHGGDTYFAESDSAKCFYDSTAQMGMVYVQNPGFSATEYLGLYTISEPWYHYFSGSYWQGRTWLINEETTDVTSPNNYVDAGYYVQWHRATLAAGATWTIHAGETVYAVNRNVATCPAGSYILNTVCTLCPAGTFSTQEDATSCQQCAPESFAATAGSTSCQDCAPATYSNTGASVCTPCPHSSCLECQNQQNRDHCTACPATWFFHSATTHHCVEHCPFNFYPSNADQWCHACSWVSLRSSVPQPWCDVNCCVPGTKEVQDGSNIASGCRSDYENFEYHQVCAWQCPNQFHNANGCNVEITTPPVCTQWTHTANYATWQWFCDAYCPTGAHECTTLAGANQICTCTQYA